VYFLDKQTVTVDQLLYLDFSGNNYYDVVFSEEIRVLLAVTGWVANDMGYSISYLYTVSVPSILSFDYFTCLQSLFLVFETFLA